MCTTALAILLSLSLTTPPAATEGLIEVRPRTANCRSVMASAASAEDRAKLAEDRAERLERDLVLAKSDDGTTTKWAAIGGVLGGLLVGGLVVGLAVAYGGD